MDVRKAIYPYLSTLNGAVVDLESKVASRSLQKVPASYSFEESSLAPAQLPAIVIYEHIDFGGSHEYTNLNWYFVGSYWNDRISSFVIVKGVWELFEHWHYEGRKWTFGPGYYRWVEQFGVPNDTISSFRCIRDT